MQGTTPSRFSNETYRRLTYSMRGTASAAAAAVVRAHQRWYVVSAAAEQQRRWQQKQYVMHGRCLASAADEAREHIESRRGMQSHLHIFTPSGVRNETHSRLACSVKEAA